LVDEFQDTSMLQWHALLPLITNALSGSGSALLVGDAKQAIYRWRNGEARQFVLMPELFGKERMATGEEHEATLLRTYTPTEALDANYRSARTIVQFNNTLFSALRGSLPAEHQAMYAGHEQRDKNPAPGHIELRCYGADEPAEEEAPAAPRFALEAVNEAVSDGFLPGDIAVLVRTKAQGRAVAQHLIAHNYQVVSVDGLSLGSDVAVRSIIAVFTWLLRPDDATAAQTVQYMALMRANTGAADPFEQGDTHTILRTWSQEHARVSTRLPLLALLHAIAEALGLDPAADAFVMGVMNEAHVFAQEQGDDPFAFLERANVPLVDPIMIKPCD
jgi:ATP-dependent exoDNAse (exonuclease V) beta subunit